MPEHRDENAIRVARIDDDRGNLLPVAQSEMAPRLPGVARLVDAVADREVRPLQPLAASDVDRVGVRGRQRDRADRACRLVVEDGPPCASVVVGLPDAAVVHTDIEDVRLAGDACRADRPPSAVRTDHAPLQSGIELRIEVLSRKHGGNQEEDATHPMSVAPQ